MKEQYKRFDIDLNKNEFLQRHSECLPFIGEKYTDSRLLLIGESHYVPKDSVQYVDRDDFYDISYDDLKDADYKSWINTRSVFEYRVYDKQDFKLFFSNTATEIARVINHSDNLSYEQKVDAMHQYAFMNYYKRPSYEKGKTIRQITDADQKYAYEVSKYIIEVLKPQLIIFLSKKSYYAFLEADKDGIASKYNIKCVSHPSCYWWNKKRNDGKCGRDDFYEYLSDYFG